MSWMNRAPALTISPVWVLLSVSMLLRALGFLYPFIGFHIANRGHGVEAAGLVLTALGVGWAAGQLACGWLLDRIGRRFTLVVTMALAAAALAATAEMHSLAALTVSALLTGMVFDGARPSVGALMFDLIPDHQQRARLEAWRFGWVANVGALICGGIGMFADTFGVGPLLWLNAAGCALVAVTALILLPADAARAVTGQVGSYRQMLGDHRFVLLWLSGLLTLTSFMGLYTALPIVMSANGLHAEAYAKVFMINAVTVIVVSPLIARPLGRALAKRGRPDLMIMTGLSMAGGMSVMGFGHSFATFCATGVALGICESAWFVISTDLVNRIAPPSLIGFYQGVWCSASAFSAIVSPVLVTAAFAVGGQHLVGIGLLVAGGVAAMLCLPLTRRPSRGRDGGMRRGMEFASAA